MTNMRKYRITVAWISNDFVRFAAATLSSSIVDACRVSSYFVVLRIVPELQTCQSKRYGR